MSHLTGRVDAGFVQRVLAELVGIDSVNPSLPSGGPGEAALAAHLGREMAELGLEVTMHEAAPGRPNVVGRLRGRGGGRSLMLNGHMDTVGVAGMAAPFAATVRHGRLYGRGAQDMKGSLAAMLGAVSSLREAGATMRGDLVLAAVCDEEVASLGTEALLRHVRTDGAIVAEPTGMTLSRAHRGFIWFDVETVGRAAHGSRYAEGVDAIMRMGRFLAGLEALEVALRERPPHELAGPPSLHAATIAGGSAPSVYAATCRLRVERRTLPGETVEAATAEIESILDKLRAADPTFRATCRVDFVRAPFETPADTPLAVAADAALTRALDATPEHTGQTFWTDAALLAAAGIDTVLIGPRGEGLHSDEEWVELASVAQLAGVLADVALSYCA